MSPASTLDDAAIRRIALGLHATTLPAPEWTHQAHFAAALWWLRHRPGFDTAAMARLIRRYNRACNRPNTAVSGYHHSITRASLAAARAALAPDASLAATLAAIMAGPCGQPGWLFAHWSRPLLFTPEARQRWIPPDIAPMPFPA
jgi:hypothetical protein